MNHKKNTLISLGISAALIAAGIWFLLNHFRFFPNSDYGWFAGHHMNMSGGMGGFMMIFWLLTIGAIALLISGALTKTGDSLDRGEDENSKAIGILKHRYAAGDIGKDEYELKLKDLRK